MGFLTGVSFLAAFVFLISGFVSLFRRKKETFKGKPKQQFLAFVILLIAGIIFAQFTDAGKENAAKEKAKQAAAQAQEEKKEAAAQRKKIAAETAKKKQKINHIKQFEADVKTNITDKSNGVIQVVAYDTNSTTTPIIKVFVTTENYLASDESEKKLFATDVDQKITSWAVKNKLEGAETAVLTDIYDVSTRSLLMSEKAFGGFTIKQ